MDTNNYTLLRIIATFEKRIKRNLNGRECQYN
jgi:hypothetical protein